MKKIMLLFLFIGLQGFAQKRINAPEIISSLLKTPDGKIFRMYETRKDMASVFVFMLPDCPACENYTLTLNSLAKKYKALGVMFYGVFPPFVKSDSIEKFRTSYKINFPLLVDYNKELLGAFDAHVAPSVYVINETTSLLYQGRIDDWMYAVGKKRTVISHHELEDALIAITSGNKIKVTQTQPVGCLID
ncbi:MAG: redoxin domain-containing protein [Bacteroidetes bacterium]|nr:redoxin domain-containing protein [Bacteroidota bacterium]